RHTRLVSDWSSDVCSSDLPIGLPLIISGVRSATLQIVSTATIAALVSLGGLGRYVVDGLKLRDFPQMFSGALLVAVLALLLDARSEERRVGKECGSDGGPD